jgi:hypothetical protein
LIGFVIFVVRGRVPSVSRKFAERERERERARERKRKKERESENIISQFAKTGVFK